jgi:hypothetical protein
MVFAGVRFRIIFGTLLLGRGLEKSRAGFPTDGGFQDDE